MKKLVIILSLLLSGLSLSAQKDTIFQRTYGGIQNDVCNQIKSTYDGGYIMIGTTNSCGAGANDFYAVKIDSLGNPQWTHTYGGPLNDEGYAVAPTFDHGYAFLGWSDNNISNGYDVELVRTDAAGNVLWQKYYGGSDWDFGYGIQQTADSGFVLVGQTYSYGAGNGDVYVIRTDKNGDTIWTRVIGGTGYDIANSVCITRDSLYAIAGATTSFGKGDTNLYFLVLDDKGNIVKDTTYGCTNNHVAYSIEPYVNKGYVVTGYTDSIIPGKPDIYLLFFDSNAVPFYQHIDSWPKGYDIGHDAAECVDGDMICAASSNTDGNGTSALLAMRAAYGGWWLSSEFEGGTLDQQGNSCAVGLNNNVVFAGATDSPGYTFGDWDFYFIRYKDDADIIPDDTAHVYHMFNQFLDTCKLTGIDEQQADEPMVKVFPNPVTSIATVIVQGGVDNKYWFNLYDVTGKRVIDNIEFKSSGHNQATVHFSKGTLQPGEYLYKVIDRNEKTATGKIIVQ